MEWRHSCFSSWRLALVSSTSRARRSGEKAGAKGRKSSFVVLGGFHGIGVGQPFVNNIPNSHPWLAIVHLLETISYSMFYNSMLRLKQTGAGTGISQGCNQALTHKSLEVSCEVHGPRRQSCCHFLTLPRYHTLPQPSLILAIGQAYLLWALEKPHDLAIICCKASRWRAGPSKAIRCPKRPSYGPWWGPDLEEWSEAGSNTTSNTWGNSLARELCMITTVSRSS